MSDRSFDFSLGLRPWPNPQRLRRPLLKEGYLLERLENSPDAFRLTAVMGSGKLSGFFQDFARLLSSESFFVLEFYENDGPVATNDEELPRVYHRKRIDAPAAIPIRSDRFWCHGVITGQGANLRRDLMRCGWYKL